MTIGEKIKLLRKKNDVTQEKLADYLNITYQSISKWENNTAMPDISLVVPLANFFGVSTDTLFDLDSKNVDEEIAAFEQKYMEFKNQGKVREGLELCRSMAGKYPHNYNCLYKLANMLLTATCSRGFSAEEQLSANNEGLEISERIMEDCTDDSIRSQTRQLLVECYDRKGDEEKAFNIANQAPSMYYSQEILSDLSYCRGEKVQKRHCDNILQYTNLLTLALWTKEYAVPDDKIKAFEAGINIWNIVVDDGNFLYYHYFIQYNYRELAKLYAQKGDKDKTMYNLNKAKYHAARSDIKFEKAVNYTGTFIDKAVHDESLSVKNYTESNTELFKEDLADKCFDFIRNDMDFIEFQNSF